MSYYQRIDRKEGEIDGRRLEEGVHVGFKQDAWGNVIRQAKRALECAGLPDRATEEWYGVGSEYQGLRMKKLMPDSPQVAASDRTDRVLEPEKRGVILIEHDGVSLRSHFRADIAEILTKYGYTIT